MKKNLSFFAFILIFLPTSVLAVATIDTSKLNHLDSGNLLDFVAKIATGIGEIVAGLGIVALLVAAIFFATAAGREEQYSKAKKALLYAVIGLAVGLGAAIISAVVKAIVGV